ARLRAPPRAAGAARRLAHRPRALLREPRRRAAAGVPHHGAGGRAARSVALAGARRPTRGRVDSAAPAPAARRAARRRPRRLRRASRLSRRPVPVALPRDPPLERGARLAGRLAPAPARRRRHARRRVRAAAAARLLAVRALRLPAVGGGAGGGDPRDRRRAPGLARARPGGPALPPLAPRRRPRSPRPQLRRPLGVARRPLRHPPPPPRRLADELRSRRAGAGGMGEPAALAAPAEVGRREGGRGWTR